MHITPLILFRALEQAAMDELLTGRFDTPERLDGLKRVLREAKVKGFQTTFPCLWMLHGAAWRAGYNVNGINMLTIGKE